ncbi:MULTISPECIES: 2-C-methyl-D-erythritol 4-phosphate cytidylyltransferase [Pseudofrankia]|uniref:2-C-methyl-D-erythritol 4-phosphate cytidylyltransferase n=1 Tax=Pseudofrankia TaxID=2994363 RepID=UPI000234B9A7|nr:MULTISPECIES: 2-C-methyl-D-erythritol 4-phosphate cytidylyltransferase [Pseudofrankia]OHV37818.1 2-C-methyl-D-erythritol 4-phosphate cytidylyltransferase [Pseudofrankia sp. EUN1h]
MSTHAAAGPVWTVVLAGGGGTRFGGPKQFFDLGGRPLVEHPVLAAGPVSDGVVVVLPPALLDRWRPELTSGTPEVLVTSGGATRAESVRAGLAAVPAAAGVIVITDAAHPLATADLYHRVVAAVRGGADAAVPGLPLTEVVKEVGPGDADRGLTDALVAGRSLVRETHRLVQTPHAFRADLLRAAHAGATEAVEDSAMVAALGAAVVVVPGEPMNIHVTTPEELTMARRLLAAGAGLVAASAGH